jgi:hypothetical protein
MQKICRTSNGPLEAKKRCEVRPSVPEIYTSKKNEEPVTLSEVSNQTNSPLTARSLKGTSRFTLTFLLTDQRTFGLYRD